MTLNGVRQFSRQRIGRSSTGYRSCNAQGSRIRWSTRLLVGYSNFARQGATDGDSLQEPPLSGDHTWQVGRWDTLRLATVRDCAWPSRARFLGAHLGRVRNSDDL